MNNMLFAGRYKARVTGESCDQVFVRTHSMCVRGDIAVGHNDLFECAVLVHERSRCVVGGIDRV